MRSEGFTSLEARVNEKMLLNYFEIKNNPFSSDCFPSMELPAQS